MNSDKPTIAQRNRAIKKECTHPRDGQPARTNLWEEGDDGLKYKWNKIGEVKDYEYTCKYCGYIQHFMNI